MRNLKKILALVLALVMSMSLMATANAFTDDASIDADYETATKVLADMGIFQGYPDGSFGPTKAITRQEVAAIMYRIASADVTDKQDALYVEGADFTDVKATDWSAGYIGYCANGGIVGGYGNGKFGPQDNVTGYQVLAMALRAVGYDKNGEFTGADWAKNVATTAQALGILKNVPGTVQLSQPATRELVAELIFQTMNVPMVEYTPAFGYQPVKVLFKSSTTLGIEQFGLASKPAADKWGRPGTEYTYNVGKKSTTVLDKAIVSYTVATTECQIAADVALKADKEYTLYTNGVVNATKYTVQRLDTLQKIGAQGTLVEVYEDVIVVIDTFLAKVEEVKVATYDAAGHLATPATIKLTVYDQTAGTTMYQTNGSTNYTWAKGDMVLVYSYTNNTPNVTTGNVVVNSVATTSTAVLGTGTVAVADYAEIKAIAAAQTGAQTFLWYNAAKHTIEGVNYDDAKWYVLDEAGYDKGTYTWYFDSYGNVIGSKEIATVYTYGIIENIQWINPVGSAGYAQATIRYMDGTTETKVITEINDVPLTYGDTGVADLANGKVCTDIARNFAAFVANDLYRIKTNTTGTVELHHVFTDDGDKVWEAGEKNEITQADINPSGTGTNALSAISNGTTAVYANANTKFLVRTAVKTGDTVTGYTFEVITGYQNMAKYTGTDVTIDWVKTDSDSYVDLVYVTGTADAATPYYGVFFLTTDEGITGALKANGTAVDYYTVNGILDGVAGEYKVAGNAKVMPANTTLTVANFATVEQKISYVLVSGDKITEIWTHAADGDEITTKVGGTKYTNMYLDIQTATTAGTTTKSGDVLKVGSVYYTVSGTPVFGTWEEVCDLSAKNVYVIYDSSKTVAISSGNVAYVAKAVYIADNAGDIIDSGAGDPFWTAFANGVMWYNDDDENLMKVANGVTLADVADELVSCTATFTTYDEYGVAHTTTYTHTANGTAQINSLLAAGATVIAVNGLGVEFEIVLG